MQYVFVKTNQPGLFIEKPRAIYTCNLGKCKKHNNNKKDKACLNWCPEWIITIQALNIPFVYMSSLLFDSYPFLVY